MIVPPIHLGMQHQSRVQTCSLLFIGNVNTEIKRLCFTQFLLPSALLYCHCIATNLTTMPRPSCHESKHGWLSFCLICPSSSASKNSIRKFIITEKAPTRAFSWFTRCLQDVEAATNFESAPSLCASALKRSIRGS